MKVELSSGFLKKLSHQVSYIAFDKPQAARKFSVDILNQVKLLGNSPFKYKKSIYFDDENIRQLTFKGYTVLFRIETEKNRILVFSLLKYQERP